MTQPQCTAHNKRGTRCQRPVVLGKRVCRYHGGAPNPDCGAPIKHGMFQYRVPESWKPAYDAAMADPNLLSLAPEISVAKAALHEFLGRCEGQPFTGEMREHVSRYLDNLSKLTEREAKRLYQESVIRELLAKQVQAEGAILQQVLSRYVNAESAERAAAEFVDLVGAAGGVGASVQL